MVCELRVKLCLQLYQQPHACKRFVFIIYNAYSYRIVST